MSTARERVVLEVGMALEDKWREGRAKATAKGEGWQGDDPLVEAHDDALDVWLYVQEKRRRKEMSSLTHAILIRHVTAVIESLRHVLYDDEDLVG